MRKYTKQSANQEGLTCEYGFDKDGYPTFSKARVSPLTVRITVIGLIQCR